MNGLDLRVAVMSDWQASWPMVATLTAALFLDTLLGCVVAFGKGALNSTTSRQGIARKVAVMIVLAFTGLLDPFTPNVIIPILGTVTLTSGAAFFLFITEGLSILEKAALLGVPIPPVLVNALEKVRDAGHPINVIGSPVPPIVTPAEAEPAQATTDSASEKL